MAGATHCILPAGEDLNMNWLTRPIAVLWTIYVKRGLPRRLG
jgi:hypothetical protein